MTELQTGQKQYAPRTLNWGHIKNIYIYYSNTIREKAQRFCFVIPNPNVTYKTYLKFVILC